VEQPDTAPNTNRARIILVIIFQPILARVIWLSYFNNCHLALLMIYLLNARKGSFSSVSDSAHYTLP